MAVTTISVPQIIREKETFRSEFFISVDGVDVKLYVKSVVNYERLTFKVQPVLSLVHGWSKEIQNGMIASVKACRHECEGRLSQYREEAGIGTQAEMSFESPASAN